MSADKHAEPREHTRWVNHYDNNSARSFSTRALADQYAPSDEENLAREGEVFSVKRIACIETTFIEGEGL